MFWTDHNVFYSIVKHDAVHIPVSLSQIKQECNVNLTWVPFSRNALDSTVKITLGKQILKNPWP